MKILRIGLTEFVTSLRSKAFIIGALAVPIFSVTAIFVQSFAAGRVDVSDKKFAVIDETGELGAILVQQAGRRGQAPPRFVPELIEHDFARRDQQLLQLSNRVRKGDLFAFIVLEEGLIDDSGFAPGARYYTDTPTYPDLPRWLERALADAITHVRIDRAGLDREQVEAMIAKPSFRTLGLVEEAVGGGVSHGEEVNTLLRGAVPVVMLFMLFVMIMTTAPALLTTTLEEKTNKVSEFLVSAVSPFQLLMGKLLGALGTSFVLGALYVGAAAGFAAHYEFLHLIPFSFFLWFFFFLFLCVMIFGAACVAIGSVCTEIRDAQSLMMPVTLLVMIPALLWQPVLQAPDGAFARAITYFPPATPMMLLLRNSIPPGLPAWELILGTLLCVGFMILAIWAAAKIFRIGLLAQGQTPTFARMLRWLFSK